MKLTKVQIKEFQSVWDSNEFGIGDITCLVGKNEAGKTTLLKALYRLNPIIPSENRFSVTDDYPRSEVEDYQMAVEKSTREHATVIEALFTLEDAEVQPVRDIFGEKAISKREITFSRGYNNKTTFNLKVNTAEALKHLFSTAKLTSDIIEPLTKTSGVNDALTFLASQEETSEVARLKEILTEVSKEGLSKYIYDNFLAERFPKFLYFDEYYQMKGQENIQMLKQRKASNTLLPSDHPMLGLIELARLNLDELVSLQRTQELKNKIQGAGNYLSKRVLQYWSQNRHLRMQFDIRPALPGDPEGMREGINIWGEIYDNRHQVSTGLGTRSRGFVWFFSFLAWYSQLQNENKPLILLLDEPALSLHAKAQEDLLKYFEAEIKGRHQLIYTTHSPFMVDPQHFNRVRIVQDKGIDTLDELPRAEEGTKVLTDVLEASEDSLFPLQGALGYEISQTLFIGPNNVVVEGVSDLLYIQVMTALLEEEGREGLSKKWTVTPVGGSDKIPTFVALIGAQKGLKIATLIDIQKKDHQTIENLYKKKLLNKNHVFTFGDFTGSDEADIEDMFETDFYLKLVNAEFKGNLQKAISPSSLNNNIPRVIVRLEEHFKAHPLKKDITFSHFRPARYFSENIGALKKDISAVTLDRFEEAFKCLNALL